METFFSIILPSKGRDSIWTSIESVKCQTYTNWHLDVILDKRFADPVIAEGLSQDSRISVYWINSPTNFSGAEARNFGIEYGTIKHPWIAYIDDDDQFLPFKLELLNDIIKQNPDVNMIKTAGQMFRVRNYGKYGRRRVRLGEINNRDIMTLGIAHTRALFNSTKGWTNSDNHDRILWSEMLANGGHPFISDASTFLFER